MLKSALNLLAVLFIGFGFLACDVYDAAVKDQVRMTGVSSGEGDTTTDPIVVTPNNPTRTTVDTVVFSATGGTGSFDWTLSIGDPDFTGATFVGDSTDTTSFTVDVTSIPTALEGPQILTIRATDSNGATGSTTLTLNPATT